MKKKLAVGILSTALLLGGATAAIGATDTAKLDEIKALTQQMFGIHKNIVDKEVEAGLITQDQADIMKKNIDQQQQRREEAIDNGQVLGPGMGRGFGMAPGQGMAPGAGIRGGYFSNGGQALTEDQIQSWKEAAQARIKAQEDAMRNNGTLTEDQIKAWVDQAQAHLELQEEALKNGSFNQGGYGMNGRGMYGGRGMRGNWSAPTVPNANTNTTQS